jgi:adenylate cyclase
MGQQMSVSLQEGPMRDELETLRRTLERKQRELSLIQAIDHIRDTVTEPSAMLVAIVNTLADQFEADLCLLCLLDRETGELELKAVNELRKYPYHLDAVTIRELAERAIQARAVAIWEGPEVASALGLPHSGASIHVATVPILMGEQPLGLILLARAERPFDAGEIALLRTAESQVDSAVLQTYSYFELQQRNKELQTIFQVDQIRDRNLPFDEMLNAVLQELSSVIQAEMGFIMLFDPVGKQLELRAVTHDDLFRVSPYYKLVDQVASESLQRGDLVYDNQLGDAIRSIMCIPLILNNEIIGVLGMVNRYGPQGFTAEDRALLRAIGSQMDTAIFEGLERRRLRRVLGRSVDPRVLERLMKHRDVEFLKGEREELSVLYADLRGSTRLAERTDPELLVEFVNDFLGRMTEIVLDNEATLDKYIGDEVMALFGAPFPQPDHALRAVRVGLEMQEAYRALVDIWSGRGVEMPGLGVGISTGEVIVGEMGCPQRTDYTVIGRAANLGSRICNVAQDGQVLISEETYEQVKAEVEAVPITGLRLKGMEHEVTAYHVIRIR